MTFAFERIVRAAVAASLLLTAAPARADAPADSAAVFPPKRPSRPAWERIVNAPFTLLYLPVGVTLKVVEEGVDFTVDHHVVARVREALTSEDGRTGVVPIATPSRGAGAKLYHRGWISHDSKVSLHARAYTHRRQDYGLEVKRVRLFEGAVSLGSFVGYEYDSDEHFFGLGMRNDPDADESDYTREMAQAEVRAGIPLGRRTIVDAVLGVEHNNITEGAESGHTATNDAFAGGTLPGAGDSHVRFARAQAAVEIDTRDTAGSPARGLLVTAAGGYFAQIGDDRYGFWKVNADVRTYVDLFYHRVLMVRAAAQSTETTSDREVPFYYLSELGSHDTIRGFSKGRFRGMDALAATLEYSWPVAQHGDFLLFADAGSVFNGFGNFELDAVEVGWGGGVRVYTRAAEVARFEFGKSRDEWRVYFSLN